MSLFSDLQADAGGSLLFDTNGEAAIYVADSGDETPLTAMLGDVRVIERKTSTGTVKVTVRDATIWCTVHPVYGGVVSPSLRAALSIGGELWSLLGISAGNANFWRLTLEKTHQRYKTREQFFVNQ